MGEISLSGACPCTDLPRNQRSWIHENWVKLERWVADHEFDHGDANDAAAAGVYQILLNHLQDIRQRSSFPACEDQLHV